MNGEFVLKYVNSIISCDYGNSPDESVAVWAHIDEDGVLVIDKIISVKKEELD